MRPGYEIALEPGALRLEELIPLASRHYAEMQARLAGDGIEVGPFNPRVEEYAKAMASGAMLTFIARHEGVAVGYALVWLTNDMHNSELIVVEDTIYALPEHRNGLGREMVKFMLAEFACRGVKRAMITPVTDLRVAKIWQRMGFKPVAQLMTYTFEGN